MTFIDTDDPFSIAAKRIRSSVIRSTPEPQLPIQGKQQPTTYIIEPDLMESQTGKMNLPNDVAFDDAGFAYNTVTGNPVQIVRRPNVLPIARTPDGFTFAMPKVLDVVGNVMGGVAGAPVKAGEVLVGSGAVRKTAQVATDVPWEVKGFENSNWYHGTTHDFDKFKLAKGNPENHLGKYPHFTTSPEDASANYAGKGPDLTGRIERRAEELLGDVDLPTYGTPEYNEVYEKAVAKATKELAGPHEGAIIPAKMKLENPVSLVDSKPTWLDFNAKYDKNGEWIKDNPNTIKLLNSLKKQGEKYGFDGQKVFDDISEKAGLYEGEVTAATLNKAMRESEHMLDAYDTKGAMISSHVISDVFKALGFDGIVMDAHLAFPNMKNIPEGTLHAVPLKQNTVKGKYNDKILYSDTRNQVYSEAGRQLEKAAQGPFYSALERTVDNAKIGKADANQWLGYLKNQPGVKQEELSWVLNNLPEGQISKQALSDIIKNNKIELKEVVKGGSSGTKEKAFELAKEHGWKSWDDIDADTQAKYMRRAAVEGGATPTKYHNYQLPGGENYQEMFLTLPKSENGLVAKPEGVKGAWNVYDKSGNKIAENLNPIMSEKEAIAFSTRHSNDQYKSSHWDEPNILVHVRYNDRDIPDVGKSLHLEEIQSDWHQAGRKQGYKGESNLDKFNELDKQLQEARADLGQAAIDSSQNSIGMSWAKFLQTKPTQEAKDAALAKIAEYRKTDARYLDKEAKVKELEEARAKANPVGKVPDAPFKKNWDELAFKRMLHKAANEGYDSVSWTPGEAQAARYDLSKQLKELQYLKHDDGTYEIAGITKNGEGFNHPDKVTSAKLPDIVGKDIAEKIIKNEGKRARGHPQNGGYFEGIDLKVGGEGMKSFYDKMLVDKASSLIKKYGGKVEKKNVNGVEIPYIKLTPELKEKAKAGFPLFSSVPITVPVSHNPFASEEKKSYTLVPVNGNPFQ